MFGLALYDIQKCEKDPDKLDVLLPQSLGLLVSMSRVQIARKELEDARSAIKGTPWRERHDMHQKKIRKASWREYFYKMD